METMKDYDIDIWGWSEININWTPNTIAAVKYMTTKIFNNCFFATLNSNNPAGQYQQGRTQMTLVNNLVGRKNSSGVDAKGLGCWSFVQIAGKDHRKIMVVRGYKPCIQEQSGDNTVTSQHKRLLTMQGSKKTPQKQWDKDFCKTINGCKED